MTLITRHCSLLINLTFFFFIPFSVTELFRTLWGLYCFKNPFRFVPAFFPVSTHLQALKSPSWRCSTWTIRHLRDFWCILCKRNLSLTPGAFALGWSMSYGCKPSIPVPPKVQCSGILVDRWFQHLCLGVLTEVLWMKPLVGFSVSLKSCLNLFLQEVSETCFTILRS